MKIFYSEQHIFHRMLSLTQMWKVMKLFTILIFALSIQLSAKSNAQDVTLKASHITLKKAFRQIEKQTGYSFFVNHQLLKEATPVSLSLKKATIDEALQACLRNQPLTYSIIDKTVILKSREIVSMTPPIKLLPQHEITGKVVDSTTGEPLVGVSIKVKGSGTGTVTDAEGKFSLKVESQAVLVVSYLGYASKEISAAGKKSITISLTTSATGLNQLVVVGYGAQKKKDLTGSISTVDMQKVEDRPVANLSQALQGLVPGLTVIRNSGGIPGSGSSFRINGYSSLNSSGPLVIVDGVPGSMDELNPDDVASVTVLKDAASTAIYGARAAEGVIIITTKSGSYNQPLKISYNANFSLQVPGEYPATNNSIDNAKLANLASTNAGNGPLYSQKEIDLYSDPSTVAYPNANNTDYVYVANVNWPKLLFNDAFEQTHQLAMSGGGQNINYRVSGNFLSQKGMFSKYGPDEYQRKTLRANLSARLIPTKLKLNVKMDYYNYNKLAPSTGYDYIFQTIGQIGSSIPVKNIDGTWARFRQQQNPIQLLEEAGFDKNSADKFASNINLHWDIMDNLSVDGFGGFWFRNGREKLWQRAYGKYTPKGTANMGFLNEPNSVTLTNYYTKYITGQFLVNYYKTIASAHHFHLLLGSSIEKHKVSNMSAFRDNIPGNNLPALSIGSNKNWKNGADEGSWAIVSYFSRLNYNYKDKYLFEANVRIDGSSRFSNKHRWGTFPSVSAGWRISNEQFMQDQRIFSNLKLRLSWGEVGNQNGLGLYDYIPVYDIGGSYPFGGGNLGQWAVSPGLASQSRTWETVVTKNIGLDIGFFKDKLSVNANYFQKKNKDMLIGVQVPSIIGIGVPSGNYGVMKTKGWDLTINWKDKPSKDFRYSVAFNMANQKNKLVYLATPYAKPSAGVINLQGYPIDAMFGYEAAGYFQTEEEVKKWAKQVPGVNAPGDIKYVDQNHDGTISAPEDLIYMGDNLPHYSFGLNLGLKYKNFDLSAFFQGVAKRNFYLTDGNPGIAPFIHPWDNNSYKIQNDYWTKDNPHALFPRPYLGTQNYRWSTHWLQNAAYVRLKNVQIGYSLPKNLISKIKANEIRVYLSGENLLTWTKMIMFDPENNNSKGYFYPIPKSYSIGLNITF